MSTVNWRKPRIAGVEGDTSFETDARVAFAKEFPCLALGLFGEEDAIWDKSPLSLTIKGMAGRLRVTLRDEDAGEYGFLDVCESLGLLSELEAAVRDGRVQWLKDNPRGKRKA